MTGVTNTDASRNNDGHARAGQAGREHPGPTKRSQANPPRRRKARRHDTLYRQFSVWAQTLAGLENEPSEKALSEGRRARLAIEMEEPPTIDWLERRCSAEEALARLHGERRLETAALENDAGAGRHMAIGSAAP